MGKLTETGARKLGREGNPREVRTDEVVKTSAVGLALESTVSRGPRTRGQNITGSHAAETVMLK